MIQALALFGAVVPVANVWPNEPQSRLELHRIIYAQQIEFLDNCLVLLLQSQLVLNIAIIPAFTASCLGQEKERGTPRRR